MNGATFAAKGTSCVISHDTETSALVNCNLPEKATVNSMLSQQSHTSLVNMY